jgi:molybdopterin biosynthesis enzyme
VTGRSGGSRPEFETREADWLGVHEAQARVLAQVQALDIEHVPLAAAVGRTLARTARARVRMPPWDNAAMDGYAVRADDVARADAGPVRLPVVGFVLAGGDASVRVGPGEACRIMTGAPLPAGADSVIRVEDTDAEVASPGTVEIRSARDAHRNVRPGGQDMEADDEVAPAGTRLTSGWIAVLGTAGVDPVPVHRSPVVAILTGGDELRPTSAFDDVAAGRAIPDSNAPMLAAAVVEAGGVPLLLGPARDDPADLRRWIEGAAGADLLLTVGGASMGEADLLKRTLEDDGLRIDFWRARIRPGSPVAFGWLPRPGARPVGPPIPLLSLPGNPASAWVTFQLLGRPLLYRMSGRPGPFPPVVSAVAGDRLPSSERLCHFHRVTLEPAPAGSARPTARLSGHTGSGLVSSLGRADALAVVPEGVASIAPGEDVEVILVKEVDGVRVPGFRAHRE